MPLESLKVALYAKQRTLLFQHSKLYRIITSISDKIRGDSRNLDLTESK